MLFLGLGLANMVAYMHGSREMQMENRECIE